MNGNKLRLKRKKRIRKKISGTSKIPRLCVFRSLTGIYAQVIDDAKRKTLASASLAEYRRTSVKDAKFKNSLEGAGKVGKLIGEKCVKIKISEVVFDRGGYKYHGKVKALAEGARKAGLKF